MTCIIGLETQDAVFTTGDSAAANSHDGFRTRLQKVLRRGPFLIGYRDSFRLGQLLQYQLDVPEQATGGAISSFMATVFVDSVPKCLKDGGSTKIEGSQESGGLFLVGYRGCVYRLASDFQVNTRPGRLFRSWVWGCRRRLPGCLHSHRQTAS